MVCIGKDEENVLQNWHKELLEEGTGGSGVSLCNVVNEFDTHV